MKCQNCGAEIQGEMCEYCGSAVSQEKTTVNITNNYYGDTTRQKNNNDEKSIGNCPKCGNCKITFRRERIATTSQSSSHKKYIGTGRYSESVSQSAYRTVGICQNCGYTWDPNLNETSKKSDKKTWLWVLGWIFIFPLPLTILLIRNKNIKPATKYGIIAFTWGLFFLIGIANGNKTDEIQTGSSPKNEIMRENSTIDTSSYENDETNTDTVNDTTSNPSTKEALRYAEDEVVNKFITEFNQNTTYEITDISKGNIRTKYFGYANGRYLEMINANDTGAKAFCLKINGGQDNVDKQSMYAVFRDAIKVINPSITNEMIDMVLVEFDTRDVLIENYAIGNDITVTYVPIKELSYGKSSCRIDISASNYN